MRMRGFRVLYWVSERAKALSGIRGVVASPIRLVAFAVWQGSSRLAWWLL
jgi:hypothetical protein